MYSIAFDVLLYVPLLLFSVAALPTTTIHDPPLSGTVSQIYQYPGEFWYENLVLRSTTPKLLVTSLSTGDILEFPTTASPSNEPFAVATLPSGLNATLGIVETEPDVFALVAGSQNFVPGTWEIWKLDLQPEALSTNGMGQLTRVTAIQEAGLLNGLALLRSPDLILAADTYGSTVYRIDLSAATYSVAINDTILAPLSSNASALGVNGLKVFPKPALLASSDSGGSGCGGAGNNSDESHKQRTLYFTNTDLKLLGSFPIDPVSGQALGPARRIATAGPASDPFSLYDDFDLDSRGNAYLANGASDILNFVDTATGEQSIVAGMRNSTLIAEPTAVALGRKGRVAFVTTAGNSAIPGAEVVGGQVLRIDL